MTVQTQTLPEIEAPSSWPPQAHLIREKDRPTKEGTIALCGAKLMGVDLKDTAVSNVCKKCAEIARKEMGQ